MSPIPKTRNLAIRQLYRLLLTINSLGTLIVVVAPRAPHTGTSLAMHRLRPILAGHEHLAAGHMALLAPTYYATATPGPVRRFAAAMSQDHQSPWCTYPALIGCLTSPPGPRSSSRRSFPMAHSMWHKLPAADVIAIPRTPSPALPEAHHGRQSTFTDSGHIQQLAMRVWPTGITGRPHARNFSLSYPVT